MLIHLSELFKFDSWISHVYPFWNKVWFYPKRFYSFQTLYFTWMITHEWFSRQNGPRLEQLLKMCLKRLTIAIWTWFFSVWCSYISFIMTDRPTDRTDLLRCHKLLLLLLLLYEFIVFVSFTHFPIIRVKFAVEASR